MIHSFFRVTLIGLVVTSAAYGASQTSSSSFGMQRPANWREHKTEVGVNLGVNSPDGSYSTTPNVGIDMGYQPSVPFNVGGELFTTNMDPDNASNQQRTALLGRGSYNFGGSVAILRDSYAGVAAGPVLTRTTWDIGLAPLIGFDTAVARISGRDLSVGVNAKYLYTTSASQDSFMANLAMKYWY